MDEIKKIEKIMDDFFITSDSLFEQRNKMRRDAQILFPIVDEQKTLKKIPDMIKPSQLDESYVSQAQIRRRNKRLGFPKPPDPIAPPPFNLCCFSALFLTGIGPIVYLIYFALEYYHYKQNVSLTHTIKIQR